MFNILMYEIEKNLEKFRKEYFLYSYFRVPNQKFRTKVFGDFLMILNNGFSVYVEAKSTKNKTITNIFGDSQLEQVDLNQKLINSNFSRHIYILGFYFENPTKYFYIEDILSIKNGMSVSYKKINIEESLNLEKILLDCITKFDSV